jgi:hypothetical protein
VLSAGKVGQVTLIQDPLPIRGIKLPPRCKDCPDQKPYRAVVPNSGSRCATHWREEKKRRKAAAHASAVAKTYDFPEGIDYESLYRFQGGYCPICRRATGKTKRLAVDHDHRTNEVRGLLCSTCNQILGHARDDINFFVRAMTYLDNPPARRLLREVARRMLDE